MARRKTASPAPGDEPLANAIFGDGRLDAPIAAESHPTRRRILDAAVQVFAEQGFRGATTREIATRAGVAEKTLFAHYRSKAAIFTAATAEGLDAMMGARAVAELVQAVSTKATLPDRLLAIARNRVEFAGNNIHLVKALAQEILLDPEFREQLGRRFATRLLPAAAGAITAGVKARVIRQVEPERVLRMFISLVAGYILTRHVLVPGRRWDDEAELRALIDVLLHGLAPTGGR